MKMRLFFDRGWEVFWLILCYTAKHALEIATVLAEVGVAFVIYLEVERSRLDRFYALAFERKYADARRQIYAAYCSLTPMPTTEAFLELLRADPDLAKLCQEQMNMLQIIGGELPWLRRPQRRVLDWFPHAIVFLRVILDAYIQEQRKLTGWPRWGNDFEFFARMAAKHILKFVKRSEGITLFDPDRGRGNNYSIDWERLKQLARGKPV